MNASNIRLNGRDYVELRLEVNVTIPSWLTSQAVTELVKEAIIHYTQPITVDSVRLIKSFQ